MNKLILILFSLLCFNAILPKIAEAQLYPEYNPPPRKKKQKEIPRFPPQFHSRDTIGKSKKDSIANKTAAAIKGKPLPRPVPKSDTTIRIISKKTDAMSNTYIEQEIIVGNRKWRQTIVVGGIALNKPFNADTIDKDSITIQVVKKNQKMYVYHKHRFLTAYKCVFGPPHLEQKEHEGDRRTPEGWFKILVIRPHKEWNTFMLIDYPNPESYKIFEANIQDGIVKKGDKIGGAIGIHGVWEGADMVVDQKRNWTDGCIALKIADLEELKKIVQPGTPIYIRRYQEKK
jgi:hypothetical protein